MSRLELGSPELSDRLTVPLGDVEELLEAQTARTDQLVDQAASHLARAGGKRLRPLLTLLCAQLGDGVNDHVLQAAAAVELTHLATLYHDDVMDSAELRRGALAVHEVWSNSVAILAGDLLFARASATVAGLGADAVAVHSRTFERLCLGQLHETFGPDQGKDPFEHYIQVLADKTGSLIATSAWYGAMYSNAGPEIAEGVERYGEKVGVAFQLADDVLDLGSDAETSGKQPGTDLRAGVDTLPVLLLKKRHTAGTLDEAGRKALDLLEGDMDDDDTVAEVVDIIRNHDVFDEARGLARQWAKDAVCELDGIPPGEVRQALEDLSTLLVDRMA